MTLTLVVRTEPPTVYLIKPDRDTFTICSAIVIGDSSDGLSLSAAKEMLDFIAFCEQNWPRLSPANPDSETLRQMQRLLNNAHTAAGDSVYTRRIELVAEYVRPLLPYLSPDFLIYDGAFTFTSSPEQNVVIRKAN